MLQSTFNYSQQNQDCDFKLDGFVFYTKCKQYIILLGNHLEKEKQYFIISTRRDETEKIPALTLKKWLTHSL